MGGGWLQRVRVRKELLLSSTGHVEFFLLLLFFFALCLSLPRTFAQPGFLSIDCGSTRAKYTDSIKLEWVSDNRTYVKTGSSFEQRFPNSSVPSFNASMGGNQALLSYRSFPDARNKYCYELPTTPGFSYMIRPSFYMNAFELRERQPFQFILSINGTNWFTISSGDVANEYDLLITQEGIFYSPGQVMYICLQPVVGVPFISSLEMRHFIAPMYPHMNQKRQYLPLLFRYNLGAVLPTPSVRYPDDPFDRIWQTLDAEFSILPNITRPRPPDNSSRGDVNYVPPKVMQDAWLFPSPGDSVSFPLYPYSMYPHTEQVTLNAAKEYVYAIVYVEDLNTTSVPNTMNVALDGYFGDVVNFSRQANMQVTPYFILNSDSISISTSAGPGLRTAPAINAVELYGQVNFNFSATTATDETAIAAFKTVFSLTDWQGDPCSPVPHNWVACMGTSQQGFGLGTSYSVTSINLSRGNSSGFSSFNSNLTALSEVSLQSLNEMIITNSGIDSPTFSLILGYFCPRNGLPNLDLSYNAIDTIPHVSVWPKQVLSLNLSHNLLAGDVMNSMIWTLNVLNLSYNSLSSLPTKWQMPFLNVLDLSHNKLKGEMLSSLDQLAFAQGSTQTIWSGNGVWSTQNSPLTELYVSDNNITGTFPTSLLNQLGVAVFDRNSISGTLDLSAWLDKWKGCLTQGGCSYGSVAHGLLGRTTQVPLSPLLSFVDNNISNLIPDAQAFEFLVNLPQLAIMLGGNPYCKNAQSYVQRYLCRSTVNDLVEEPRNPNNNVLIIGLCVGAVVLIITSSAIGTIMWKLLKQVSALKEIQQVLERQKVQPPFFEYNDLKLATKDFHRNNKLGHGGFGIVYKGALPDETTFAVKKLFNSEKLELLNEFLNEVVLITGIKHRNLVQLKGCCIQEKQRILVYEYVENGNLAEALWGCRSHGCLSWEQRFNVCLGVARGLSYLHEELQPSIIHRDIKPENILLDANFMPKIADFGLAKHFPDGASQALFTKVAGTVGYFSPEYATQGELSEKADVYSYGIVVLEIISGRKCIDSSLPPEKRFLSKWVHLMLKKGSLLDVVQPELRDTCAVAEVIRAINVGLLCVQQDSQKRPSMSQVVRLLLGNMDKNVFSEQSKYDLFVAKARYLNSHSMSTSQSFCEVESISPPSLSMGEEITLTLAR